MKLTIFAATGGVGRLVVDQALAAGHDVTAVVRTPARVTRDIHVIAADLMDADPATLENAVKTADAVLSCFGPHTRAESGIVSPGTSPIIAAMRATGARRIVVVSAAPVSTFASPGRPNPPAHDPGEAFLIRRILGPVVRSLLRRHYEDLALMEDMLRASGLDWTSARPNRLTNGPLTGHYREAYGRNVRKGLTISRADTAHFMLAALSRPETIGAEVSLAY
jgi:putative NADH-flavin reductase